MKAIIFLFTSFITFANLVYGQSAYSGESLPAIPDERLPVFPDERLPVAAGLDH